MKQTLIAAACGFVVCASYSQAWELELPLGSGLANDPLVSYLMSDNTIKDLHAGDGVGILLGQSIYKTGKLNLNLKGGFQFGSLNTPVSAAVEIKDRFTYFPLFAFASYNITDKLSVTAGTNYMLFPKYTTAAADYKATFKFNSGIGYNFDIRYDFVKGDPSAPIDLYYGVSYFSNKAQFNSFSDTDGESAQATGSEEPLEVQAVSLALGFRF